MRLVLLGDPVAHSRSPAIHQAALDHLGIPGRYEARRVDGAGLAGAVAELRAGTLDGANVTMPHKAAAAALADRSTGDARRAGAVNTLSVAAGEVRGALTDVGGVRRAWQWAGLPDDVPVLVLGAGGAAGAALLALEGRAPAVSARRPDAAAALAARIGVAAEVVGWGEARPGRVVVNATPLGMGGEPLPAGVLDGALGLFDMAYGAEPTPAVAAFRAAGRPAADGLDMLVAQAAESFTIWTGEPAPVEVMRAALR